VGGSLIRLSFVSGASLMNIRDPLEVEIDDPEEYTARGGTTVCVWLEEVKFEREAILRAWGLRYPYHDGWQVNQTLVERFPRQEGLRTAVLERKLFGGTA